MASKLTAADLENAVRALVTAEESNLGIEVTVPVAYGDGDLATVVVERASDGFVVHDAGFSAMRLTAAGVNLSKNVVHRLNEFSHRYKASFADGRVSLEVPAAGVATAVALVANASRSVADYVYELRRQADYDFRVVVVDRIKEIVGNRIRDSEEYVGRSGQRYRIPILLDPSQKRPQNFLTTLAHRSAVARSFAMFYDLHGAYPDVERDAIYDGDADFKSEDRALLSSAGIKAIPFLEAPLRFSQMVGNVQSH